MARVPERPAGRTLSPALLPRFLFPVLAALLISFLGCRPKQLTPAELRAITRKLVFAAKNATSGKAEIGMRPENLAQQAGGRPGEPVPDHIYVTLPLGRSGQLDPRALEALENELDHVAERHGLARHARPGAPGLVRFDYRRGDQRTHAIHIITPLTRPPTKAPARGARAASAQLAIILDDLGYDRAAADALFALPFPLTLAVLPNLAHSADIAEEAHRRGYQVMLHLPMESSNGEARPESTELRAGMSPAEATRLLARMLESVPHAVGVNNHQGSLATTDAQLMTAVMSALRERQLFFVDSRTTTATLAYDAAVRAGVPAAARKVFLDDTPTREAVRQQLALAARHARRQGSAIAIGHPHAITLQVLGEYLPELEAQGVRLVFVSELVR